MKPVFLIFCKIFLFPWLRPMTRKIEGKDNIPQKGNFIFVANHQSSLDHWLITMVLQKRYREVSFLGAMEGLRGYLQSRLLYYVSETVSIDRGEINREKILAKMEELLSQGRIIVIYPEGTCNTSNELLRGKSGAAELALKAGVPIVPFGIERVSRFKIFVKVGKPIYFLKEMEEAKKIDKNSKDYYLLLRATTGKIMEELSKLCNKKYLYGN